MSGTSTSSEHLGTLRRIFQSPILAATALAAVVITVGLAVFDWRREVRVTELDEQYARAAAHMGRQVELLLEAYSRVAQNLGPVAFGGQPVTEATGQILESRLQRQLMEESLGIVTEQVQAATSEAKAAEGLEKRAKHRHNKLKQILEGVSKTAEHEVGEALEAAEALKTARAKATAAAKEVTNRATQVEEKSKIAEDKTKEVEKAAEKLREAQLLAATTTLPANQSNPDMGGDEGGGEAETEAATTSPGSGEAAERSGNDAVPPSDGDRGQPTSESMEQARGLQRAEEEFAAATKASEKAVLDYQKASSDHKRALDDYREKLDAADDAEELADETLTAALEAAGKVEEQEELVNDQRRTQEAARSKARRSADRRSQLTKELEALQADFSRVSATTEKERLAYELLTERIRQAAPPSYGDLLDDCLRGSTASQPTSGVREGTGTAEPPQRIRGSTEDNEELRRVRCLFGKLIRANGIETETLRYVPCEHPTSPHWRQLPHFAPDRRSIRFPILNDEALTQGCVRVEIENLLHVGEASDTGWPRSDDNRFTDVFMLGRDGTVLVSDPQSSIRLEKLPELDPAKPLASGRIEDVEIGATRYRAYLQPINTRLGFACGQGECADEAAKPVGSAGVGLMIVALVPEDQFAGESFEITPFAFLLTSFVVVLIMLAFPLAKLWSIGPRSPFSRLDVALMASAAGIVALVLTVAAWSVLAGHRLEQQVDEQLDEVANELENLLDEDFEQATKALGHFEEETTQYRAAHLARGGVTNRDTAWAASDAEPENRCPGKPRNWPGYRRQGFSPEYCEKTGYDFGGNQCGSGKACRQASWADADGNQRLKYAGGPHARVPVNVGGRSYFHRATEGKPCDRREARLNAGRPVVAEVVRSSSTVESIVILARATCDRRDDASATGVVAVSYEPDLLERIVPPSGTRVAVIDADGRVMLHSDPRVFHGHVFFDDVQEPHELQALVDARIAGFLDIRYLQAPVRVRVEYVKDYDWFIITMAPTGVVDTAISGMVLLTLFGCGAFFLTELGLLWLGSFTRRLFQRPGLHSQRGSPRPTKRRRAMYTCGGLGGLLIGLLVWIWTTTTRLHAGVFWWCVIVLFVISLLFWLLPRVDELGRWLGAMDVLRLSTAKLYTIWYLGLACVFYMCPACVMFAATYDRVVENQARAAQMSCVRALSDPGTPTERRCVPSMDREGAMAKPTTDDVPPHFIDLLPGFWLSQQLAGHQHRIGRDDEQGKRWEWSRSGDDLDLRFEGRTLHSELPRPLDFHMTDMKRRGSDPEPGVTAAPIEGTESSHLHAHMKFETFAMWAGALLLLLLLLTLSVSLLHISLCRLHFIDVIDDEDLKPGTVGEDETENALWTSVAAKSDEQHVLLGLAVHGVATPHPRLEPAVRRLVERGLLDPNDLQILPRLEKHVRLLHAQNAIEPTVTHDSRWETLRAPLLTGFVVLATALGLSEPDVGTMGLLAPALVAAFPAFLRVLTALGKGSEARGP